MDNKEQWVHSVFEGISGKYDLMNDIESLGLHRLWKQSLLRGVLRCRPRDVLDLACGTGDISMLLAKALPQARVCGLDFSGNMLAVARRRAAGRLPMTWSYDGAGAMRPDNKLCFIEGNAMSLPFDAESFDVVTISFGLRNMADYHQVASEICRVLRPGGAFFCLDASYPTLPVVRPAFKVYFKHLLPAVANVVTRQPEQYRWLNDSTEAFLTKDELVLLFVQAGFERVSCRSFMLGAAALHYGFKP
jgi:demethylmenaquinone methyltransferase/2-methoxy-6-polyprenyl-1,4-benzoquinol methylase